MSKCYYIGPPLYKGGRKGKVFGKDRSPITSGPHCIREGGRGRFSGRIEVQLHRAPTV